jgi:copper homeostasis protein
MAVTFHRAFDRARDLDAALDALIALGVDRVLTSGGAPDAFQGRFALRRLVERARGRIAVMAGGGVRAHNAAAILADASARELHSSTPFPVE